ncbi:MAG: acetolactate synthase [Clostridia bacterium]|nr:acetolactate synthase [Clostridia bacterium]
MLIDQISIFVSNQHGRLTDITSVLVDAGIDIRALSLADTTEFGILRLIVSDPDAAEEALKGRNVIVRKTKVIAALLDDKPGALNSVLKVLTDVNISIEYAYAFITPKDDDACVILRVEENERAIKTLTENGVKLLAPEDIYRV